MRALVVGAGPAGLYATRTLLAHYPTIKVDLIDRLPTPFGLIRYGVSPDHPHTKNAIQTLSPILSHPDVTFYGNVSPPADTRPYAHLTIWATGASQPRTHQLLGQNVILADTFAKWVNAHPELSEQQRLQIERAICNDGNVVVVGVGNVALDVARMLLRDVDEMRHTDISERALQILAQQRVHNVMLVGRKSPRGAAWTTAALREVVQKIKGVTTRVPLRMVEHDLEQEHDRKKKRMLKVLAQCVDENHEVGGKILDLRFLYSPTHVEHQPNGMKITFQHAHDMQEMVVHADAAFLSLGYLGGSGDGYRVGWANGKANGIIGDNLHSAQQVISSLPPLDTRVSKPGIGEWTRQQNIETVDYAGWLHIDEEEKRRAVQYGRKEGRVKLDTIDALLAVARGPAPT